MLKIRSVVKVRCCRSDVYQMGMRWRREREREAEREKERGESE